MMLSPLDEDSSVESEHILLSVSEPKINKNDGSLENNDGKKALFIDHYFKNT